MPTTHARTALIALLVPLVAACGERATPEAGGAAQPTANAMPSVAILTPADGGEVMGPDVGVQLSATGVQIVPAGDMTPGTGHHHLYLDADLTAANVPVPTVPGSIIHMGTGVSEYTFQGVSPGQHRLIAVVADGAHTPLQPWVVDTVTFTVR